MIIDLLQRWMRTILLINSRRIIQGSSSTIRPIGLIPASKWINQVRNWEEDNSIVSAIGINRTRRKLHNNRKYDSSNKKMISLLRYLKVGVRQHQNRRTLGMLVNLLLFKITRGSLIYHNTQIPPLTNFNRQTSYKTRSSAEFKI